MIAPSLIAGASALLILGAAGCARKTAEAQLPTQIQELRASLQGIPRARLLEQITRKIGSPSRDVGSGLSILEWDVAGGTLTFHPTNGLTFQDARGVVRLLETHNALGANLVGGWEVSTLPDAANHGSQTWLAQVELHADGGYRFVPSGSGGHGSVSGLRFFERHPGGSWAVTYAPSLGPEVLLESLTEDRDVAIVTLSGTAAGPGFLVAVRVRPGSRSLEWVAPDGSALDYRCSKRWANAFE